MSVHQFPYQGTWGELNHIRSELAKVQSARARLARQEEVLQDQQRHVLQLIKRKQQDAIGNLQLEFPDA